MAGLGRLAASSYFRSVAQLDPFSAYTPQHVARWAYRFARYLTRERHRFVAAKRVETTNRIGNVCRLSLAGNWATGTAEAARVAAQMREWAPNWTVHLGDTYYVGSSAEVSENFLGVRPLSGGTPYLPVAFPRGTDGTRALCGNHEMYSRGEGYYNTLLPAVDQPASYFVLENDFWRVVGLDTAYNSDCHLEQEHVDWVESLDLGGDSRGVVLLTHHNPISRRGDSYTRFLDQVAEHLPERVVWLWAHEHRLAIYRPRVVGGVVISGRCVGHGGVPVDLGDPGDEQVIFHDQRRYPNDEGLTVGYNGFANVQLRDNIMVIDYRDLFGKALRFDVFNSAEVSP
jgi:hypothetical protein